MTIATTGKTYRSLDEAAAFIYRSYNKAKPHLDGRFPDAVVRAAHPAWTRCILDALGAPDQAFPSVLVVGSKGKGSTAVMIAALLQAAGRRVGLFTSPHLVSLTERIRVNGRAIPPSDFLHLLEEITPAVECLERTLPEDRYVSPISLLLAVACLHFRAQAVDVAVLECGRGGPCDPTHAVPHPWVVMTEMMAEHVTELGPTLAAVAEHKAGVIQAGVKAVFCGSNSRIVARIVRRRARREGASTFLHGVDFGAAELAMSRSGVRGRIWIHGRAFGLVALGMLGAFQMQNAALAVQAVDQIAGPLHPRLVQSALSAIRVPGRCQVIGDRPVVLIDGSIHRKSAGHLKEIVNLVGARPVVSVVAVPLEKDYRGVLDTLAPISDVLITTEVPGSGFVFPREQAVIHARRRGRGVRHVSSVVEALDEAVARAGPTGFVLAVGTQVFLGAVFRALRMDVGQPWDEPPPWDVILKREGEPGGP